MQKNEGRGIQKGDRRYHQAMSAGIDEQVKRTEMMEAINRLSGVAVKGLYDPGQVNLWQVQDATATGLH